MPRLGPGAGCSVRALGVPILITLGFSRPTRLTTDTSMRALKTDPRRVAPRMTHHRGFRSDASVCPALSTRNTHVAHFMLYAYYGTYVWTRHCLSSPSEVAHHPFCSAHYPTFIPKVEQGFDLIDLTPDGHYTRECECPSGTRSDSRL